MSNNYTIKSFGLNIIPQEKKEYVEKKVEKAVSSLWDPVLEYLKENENVFSGDVSQEIQKLNIQTLNLGMAMRKGESKHEFDEKC